MNELLVADPAYARTYYQLGCIHYYHIKDYFSAGYFFSKCIQLEPNFPDVYADFIKLLVFLKRDKQLKKVAQNALKIPGVNQFRLYEQLGLFEEAEGNFEQASDCYRKAMNLSLNKEKFDEMNEALTRVKRKVQFSLRYVYS